MVTTSLLLGPPLAIRSVPADTPMITSSSVDTPPMGLTENGSATYLATGNPCLDFFFHVVPDTSSDDVIERLEKAWAFSPLTTLKLVCNLRGVCGTGKSDKAGFYTSALWIHKHHPKTLACNVTAISDFGYFKDFLEILYRLLYGESARSTQKEEWEAKKRALKYEKKKKIGRKVIKLTEDREKVLSLRHEKTTEKAKKALERYSRDPEYRFLHERVSDFFAEILKSDVKFLNNGELKNISLAAKWCPSLDSSFDKATLICESIAKKMFSREDYMEYSDLEEVHYAYRARNRLRKEVLVPLREALKLPEVYMCAKKWDKIPFNRVASVAMKIYKKLFYKHDKERFEEYLEKVKSGKATIAAGALLPHEIIGSLNDEGGADVAELQWKRMVDDVAQKGKLTNCIAVCDVSGQGEALFDENSFKDLVGWSSMINGYGINGYGNEALKTFSTMLNHGITPNEVVFISLLSACSHCGLEREGWYWFNTMKNMYGITPMLAHFACMVDLLSRQGHVKEALDFVKNMPVEPDTRIWGAVLAGCRSTCGYIEIAEYVVEQLIRLDPENKSCYVVLSNLYAEQCRWDDVENVRKFVNEKGLMKETGYSSVEANS